MFIALVKLGHKDAITHHYKRCKSAPYLAFDRKRALNYLHCTFLTSTPRITLISYEADQLALFLPPQK
jgi:hypothetical protein